VARRRFQQALATTKRVPPARHVNRIPSIPSNGQKQAAAGSPVVGGFFVNWDDNSYASLAANLKDLDVVVLEWGFVAGGGDSLRLDTLNGKRAMARILQEPVEKRPRLLVMVSNFDSTKQEFGTSELRSLLVRPAARARAIAQLTQVVQANGLAGVLVDFEAATNFPHLHELSMTFTRELAAALHPLDKSIAYATPSYATNAELREIASTVDQVFAMLDSMGSRPGRSLVVACEPADVTAGMGLSDQVREALPHAVRAVEKILEQGQRKKEADNVHAD